MLNVHDEPSLQKESTLIIYANTTPDGDETSPQKKAPLVKLNGTPERNESSYIPEERAAHQAARAARPGQARPDQHRLWGHQGRHALAPEGGAA